VRGRGRKKEGSAIYPKKRRGRSVSGVHAQAAKPSFEQAAVAQSDKEWVNIVFSKIFFLKKG